LASIFERIWLADSQILAASCCLFTVDGFWFFVHADGMKFAAAGRVDAATGWNFKWMRRSIAPNTCPRKAHTYPARHMAGQYGWKRVFPGYPDKQAEAELQA
jgi:hypothetical protein